MRDIYKELLKRSVEDAASIAREINEEDEELHIGGEFVSKGAMALYHQRVRKQEMKWHQAQGPQYPEDDGRNYR